jgi:hypothetical protein
MCQFGAHDVSFQPDKSRGEQNRFTLARVPDSLSRGQEFEIGRSLLRQRLESRTVVRLLSARVEGKRIETLLASS